MTFKNVYEDNKRAESYATLEFPGSYYLAFRDIPSLIQQHVKGSKAMDFGCGTGRSTRFLQDLGYETLGIDISLEMLDHAKSRSPEIQFQKVPDGDLSNVPDDSFDLILAAFTFDNIKIEDKPNILQQLKSKLTSNGCLMILVSSPNIYYHEWASFSTADFPENRQAGNGERVKIIMLDVEDARPVEDILCTDESYQNLFEDEGLQVIKRHEPLGTSGDGIAWKKETELSPWCIYVLAKAS